MADERSIRGIVATCVEKGFEATGGAVEIVDGTDL